MEPEVLTVKEAAAMLRVSQATVMRMIQRGTLRANKVAWLWRIPRAEVERYLRAQGSTPAGKVEEGEDSPLVTAPAFVA